MFTNLFGWLRRRTTEAILAGVGDALERLDGPAENSGIPELPEPIRRRLALALPDSPEPSTNGRKRKE